MKITYDKSVNAVYIDLTELKDQVFAKKTYPCDPIKVNGQINLDFDKDERLIGIEVLGASKKLPKEILDNAEIIG